ncbi:MAG: PDZ domain-containing protein [Proteobacteria bacterium]|nr:PDZ domain-containing protein [Pseudomonadota bacterium]
MAKRDKPGPEPGARIGLQLQALSPDLAARLGLKGARGLIVTRIRPGSPAARAGLRPRDVIVEVNQKPIQSPDQFWRAAKRVAKDKGLLLLVSRGRRTFYLILRPEL